MKAKPTDAQRTALNSLREKHEYVTWSVHGRRYVSPGIRIGKSTMKALADRGWVADTGTGHWRITAAGEAAVGEAG